MDDGIPTSVRKNLDEHQYAMDDRYRNRIQGIMKRYSGFRECIRDGNCLYTSYSIALADLISSEGGELLRRLMDVFEEINSRFHLHGIDELGYSGFHESFIDILNDVMSGSKKIEEIPLYSWYDCVAYLRLVASDEMKMNPDRYQPYIPEMNVDKYCTMYVDPFYKEAGYVEICALSNSIPIMIQVVDITKDTDDVYGDHPQKISILYTHNHFEPIYEVAG